MIKKLNNEKINKLCGEVIDLLKPHGEHYAIAVIETLKDTFPFDYLIVEKSKSTTDVDLGEMYDG